MPPGHVAVPHMRAEDAPNGDRRDRIYRRHQVLECLSVAARDDDGARLAVNLHHHEHRGPLTGVERERFEAIAPLLMAAVRRHRAPSSGSGCTSAASCLPGSAVAATAMFPQGDRHAPPTRREPLIAAGAIALGAASSADALPKPQGVVDKQAGAGAQIAAQGVAKSPDHGDGLLLGELGSTAIAPPAFSKLPDDPAREPVGISEVVRSGFPLGVPANSPHQSLSEFVKAGRARTHQTTFGTRRRHAPRREAVVEATGFGGD